MNTATNSIADATAYTATVLVPLEAKSLNKKDSHFMTRSRRVKAIREAVGLMFGPVKKPVLPCSVVLCRIANSTGLDEHDNLPGSLKPFVDGVAKWLGIDDRSNMVKWAYSQERGAGYGVRITVSADA